MLRCGRMLFIALLLLPQSPSDCARVGIKSAVEEESNLTLGYESFSSSGEWEEVSAQSVLGLDPETQIKELSMRSCIIDLATQFEEFAVAHSFPQLTTEVYHVLHLIKGERELSLPDEKSDTLAEALSDMWRLQDISWKGLADALKGEQFDNSLGDRVSRFAGTKDLTEALRITRDAIKERGFSLTAATNKCNNIIGGRPPQEDIDQCILHRVETNQSSSWWGFSDYNYKKTQQKSSLKFDDMSFRVLPLPWETEGDMSTFSALRQLVKDMDLPKVLQMRWPLQKRLDIAKGISTRTLQTHPQVSALISKLEKEMERLEGIIANIFKFQERDTKRSCIRSLKKEAGRPSQSVTSINRIVDELKSPVHGNILQCAEQQGRFCPEGMSPGNKRKTRPERTAIVAAAAIVWKIPVVSLFTVVGGPGVGTAAMLAPSEWLIAGPLSLLVSRDLFPTCRCWEDLCKYNEQLNTCEMRPKARSDNPYHWLPYSGQKCAPQASPNGGKVTCKLQMCSPEDFAGSHAQAPGVTGKIGYMPADPSLGVDAQGVFNCLSSDGHGGTQLLFNQKLPEETGPVSNAPNSPENRARLYSILEITRAGQEAPWPRSTLSLGHSMCIRQQGCIDAADQQCLNPQLQPKARVTLPDATFPCKFDQSDSHDSEVPAKGSALDESLERGLLSREFSDFQLIGSGGFGKVFKAWHKSDRQWYAVKLIPLQLRASETADDNRSNWSGPDVFSRLQSIRSSKVLRYFRRWAELPEDLPAPCSKLVSSADAACLRPVADPTQPVPTISIFDKTESTCGFEWAKPSLQQGSEAAQAPSLQCQRSPCTDRRYGVVLAVQMEYCDGVTLADWLLHPRLRPRIVKGGLESALHLFSQLMSGLADIHSAGIVHWDIKPGNVLVAKDSGQIKIFDFGLAKRRAKGCHHATSRSPPGSGSQLSRTAIGTPGYAPPEHCSYIQGSPESSGGCGIPSPRAHFVLPPACPGADIFSAGIVLIELLMAGVAGDAPAWGTAMERVKVLGALRDGCDAALPLKLLRAPGVEGWMRQLVFRMLSWDAEGRPSAQEVLDEIEASHWASTRHNPFIGTHHSRSPQFASMLAHVSAAHNPYIGFFLDHRPTYTGVLAA